MKNIKKLFKIIFIQWKLMVTGFFTMLMFSVLSGISITMAVPLFDYVFGTKRIASEIDTFSVFWSKISNSLQHLFSSISFSNLFDKSIYDSFLDSLKDVLSITDPFFLLWVISLGMILLIVLKNLFFYLNKIIFVSLRGKTVERIRNILFQKYLLLSMNFYKDSKIGDLQVRLTSDVTIISDLFIQSMFGSLRNITLIIIYVFIALFINPKLFLYVIIIVPIFSFTISYIGGKIKKYSKRIQKTYSILYSKMEEVFNGIKIVKSYSKEDYELEKFSKENHNFYKSWMKSHLYQSVNVPLSELNGVITGVVVLLIGGRLVLNHDAGLSFGGFTAFLFAVFSILHPMKELTKYYTGIRRALVSLDRVFAIINLKPTVVESKNPIEKIDFKNKLEIENGREPLYLDQLGDDLTTFFTNTKINSQKLRMVILIWDSRIGKSTLVNLIERFYDPNEGSISLDGINIKQIKLKKLHNLFGTVTQESILFNDTVENNIRYGSNDNVSLEDVKKAAKIAFADEFIEKMPNQYQEMLHPKASNLSGGEKQRLCIARAVVGNPPILIFDEATSSLDSEAEQKVQKAIEEATKDRTVIMIAHRLSTVLNADKIIVFDDGEIVGMGKHEELLKTCSKYKLLYNIQFKG